jgi:hypothetical protein
MNRALIILSVIAICASAQERTSSIVKGLRIEGSLNAQFPVAFRSSHPVTVSFDLTEVDAQNIHVRIWHCDRNWKRTVSVFVNDRFRNVSFGPFPTILAPLDVKGYRSSVRFQIPGISGLEQLALSGNYELELWNAAETEVFATGRFFAAETLASKVLRVDNRLLPMASAPMNQVHRVAVAFTVPSPSTDDAIPIALVNVRMADVYRDRELGRRFRIDADDSDVETFVDGFGTRSLQFSVANIPAGNNYRTIDVRDVRKYPLGRTLRSLEGADVGRSFAKGLRDRDGGYVLLTEGRDADYVRVRFEFLRPDEMGMEDIRVVGAFNGWNPSPEWRLQRTEQANRYFLETELRRGAYDYQYVLGEDDWCALEGNDWRTKCTYTALVYYADAQFGGYDRILMVAQGQSPGGTDETIR